MKKILVLAMVLIVAGCNTQTAYGPCVGAFDQQDPALRYKLSIWNTFMGIIFFETIIVPIVVVANETVCPVGKVYKTEK